MSSSMDLEENSNYCDGFIIKADQFKSNFARKFSNRFVGVKAPALANSETAAVSALEPNPVSSDIDDSQKCSCNCKMPNVIIKTLPRSFDSLKMDALQQEVHSLKWQLEQTETSRIMHVKVLEEVLSVLFKVHEHFDEVKTEQSINSTYKQITPNACDLSKLKSKSTSDVNRVAKLTLCTKNAPAHPKPNEKDKLCNELSRLVTLINSVLSTKLPNLEPILELGRSDHELGHDENHRMLYTHMTNELCDSFSIVPFESDNLSTSLSTSNIYEDLQPVEMDMTIPESPDGVDEDFFEANGHTVIEDILYSDGKRVKESRKKGNDGESGFSSMTSYHELGIPSSGNEHATKYSVFWV